MDDYIRIAPKRLKLTIRSEISKMEKILKAKRKFNEAKLVQYRAKERLWRKEVLEWRKSNASKPDYSENHPEEAKFRMLDQKITRKINHLIKKIENVSLDAVKQKCEVILNYQSDIENSTTFNT